MSRYNNETKIYPDLNPSAPQETQACRLKKLTEIDTFFLDEIEFRRRQVKKKKRLNMVTRIVDTGLITSASITRVPLSQHSPAALAYPLALP